MKRILFVCLGNICRSPAAEAVMQSLLRKKGELDNFIIDSAGTSAYHAGEPADSRMITHGQKRGHKLLSISRGFDENKDFRDFDLIITMDDSNYANVLALTDNPVDQSKVKKMTDFCQDLQDTEVPDPYYGGAAGFENVLDLLEDACEGLYNSIKQNG